MNYLSQQQSQQYQQGLPAGNHISNSSMSPTPVIAVPQQPQQVDALVISDLPLECKEPELLALAQSYGRVKSCEIKRDFRNHVITVYGILSYYNVESADNAYRALHGARYMGKTLRYAPILCLLYIP
jgi:RNA recognition motif-containing protein